MIGRVRIPEYIIPFNFFQSIPKLTARITVNIST
jgi:hypothetical protein